MATWYYVITGQFIDIATLIPPPNLRYEVAVSTILFISVALFKSERMIASHRN